MQRPPESAPGEQGWVLSRRQFLATAAASTYLGTAVAVEREWLALRGNILLTQLNPPEAPINIDGSQPELERHVIPLYNKLVTQFSTHNGLFLEENRDTSTRYAMAWPFSMATVAVRAARGLGGSIGRDAKSRYRDMYRSLDMYWLEDREHGAGFLPGLRADTNKVEFYIDDGLWLADMLLDHYTETRDPVAIQRAEKIWRLGVSQWNQRWGGVRWKRLQPGDESGMVVVSNAPLASLGARLSLIKRSMYFYNGEAIGCPQIIDWLDTNLRDPEDGLYWDNMGIDGGIETTKHTYCQGVVVGAKVAMHRVQPTEDKLLQEAYDLANSSLSHFRLDNDNDTALPWEGQASSEASIPLPGFNYNGDDKSRDFTFGEGEYVNNTFDAIFFRNLLSLCDRLPDQAGFRQRVVQALHRRVNVLEDEYDTLLDQAGALQLAILAHQHPITWRSVAGPVVLPTELLSTANSRRNVS